MEEYLHQGLLYLQSPQEPLREVAVRFIGEPQPAWGSLTAPQQLSPSHGYCQSHRGAAEPQLPDVIDVGLGPSWPLHAPGATLGSALPSEPAGVNWAAGVVRSAGSVTGCVCLGLTGQQLKDGCKEKILVINEGE